VGDRLQSHRVCAVLPRSSRDPDLSVHRHRPKTVCRLEGPPPSSAGLSLLVITLLDLGLPSFETVIHNFRHSFSVMWSNHYNAVIQFLRRI